jgi:pSer/pThr/pTyr-binding forkhead associated (FHA) protein
MPAFVEIQRPTGVEVVPLEGERVALGQDPANDIVVADRRVSRIHAVFERLAAGWSLRDLGSRNGTYLNGERLTSERVLRPGDEILVGRTRLAFRGDTRAVHPTTEAGVPPPRLTPRERDVLVALCGPLLQGAAFSQPATTKEIAAGLFVTEATVKEYLGRLYDKFGFHDERRRRVVLANEALERGAVTVADLRRG